MSYIVGVWFTSGNDCVTLPPAIDLVILCTIFPKASRQSTSSAGAGLPSTEEPRKYLEEAIDRGKIRIRLKITYGGLHRQYDNKSEISMLHDYLRDTLAIICKEGKYCRIKTQYTYIKTWLLLMLPTQEGAAGVITSQTISK